MRRTKHRRGRSTRSKKGGWGSCKNIETHLDNTPADKDLCTVAKCHAQFVKNPGFHGADCMGDGTDEASMNAAMIYEEHMNKCNSQGGGKRRKSRKHRKSRKGTKKGMRRKTARRAYVKRRKTRKH